jgi:hypothetical protein
VKDKKWCVIKKTTTFAEEEEVLEKKKSPFDDLLCAFSVGVLSSNTLL